MPAADGQGAHHLHRERSGGKDEVVNINLCFNGLSEQLNFAIISDKTG